MATQNNESTKYDKLVAGHAAALGITDINNMTEEQDHELTKRLEDFGVVKPQSVAALPGTAGINPSAGSEITQTTKGKASKRTGKAATAAQKVSPAAYDGDVMRVLEHFAKEGDGVAALGMEIYRGAMGRRVQTEMAALVIDATVSSAHTGSADSFLDNFGY